MEDLPSFEIERKYRDKKTYLGKWQLQQAFSYLDNAVENMQRDMLIGMSIPLALHDYKPASYLRKELNNPEMEQKKDELIVLSGYINNVAEYARTNEGQTLIPGQRKAIQSIQEAIASGQNYDSALFKTGFVGTVFSKKKNLENFFSNMGSDLYERVLHDGRLTGNATIIARNYHAVNSVMGSVGRNEKS